MIQVQNGTDSVRYSGTIAQALLIIPSAPTIWNSGMNSRLSGTR